MVNEHRLVVQQKSPELRELDSLGRGASGISTVHETLEGALVCCYIFVCWGIGRALSSAVNKRQAHANTFSVAASRFGPCFLGSGRLQNRPLQAKPLNKGQLTRREALFDADCRACSGNSHALSIGVPRSPAPLQSRYKGCKARTGALHQNCPPSDQTNHVCGDVGVAQMAAHIAHSAHCAPKHSDGASFGCCRAFHGRSLGTRLAAIRSPMQLLWKAFGCIKIMQKYVLKIRRNDVSIENQCILWRTSGTLGDETKRNRSLKLIVIPMTFEWMSKIQR